MTSITEKIDKYLNEDIPIEMAKAAQELINEWDSNGILRRKGTRVKIPENEIEKFAKKKGLKDFDKFLRVLEEYGGIVDRSK